MTLQQTRLRLTQAILFGHPPNGVAPILTGYVKRDGSTLLTNYWNAGNFSVTSHNSVDWVNAGAYGFTSAGIKAAIAATPYGGTCYLPVGTYVLADADLPIIRTTPISIVGAGNGSVLLVSATLGAGIDVIVLQPTNSAPPARDGLFWSLRNFRIKPAAGMPGRHAIHLDATNGLLEELLIENMSVEWLGGDAIHGDGAFTGGIPTLSTIRNSRLAGGIQLLTGGDTVRILDNGISMPYANHAGVDVTLVGGASTLKISGNNIGACDGGCIHVGGAPYNVLIEDNEFETNVSFAGSNGAVVDVDGAAYGTKILNNSFQVVNGATAIGLRINTGLDAYVAGNVFERGVGGSVDIAITAPATSTVIGPNSWVSGGPFASMVSDAGTGTVLDTEWQGKRLMTYGIGLNTTVPKGDLDIGGGILVSQALSTNNTFVANNVYFYGAVFRYIDRKR